MKKSVVINNYKADSLIGYQFEWNGNVYQIKSEPYKLIIEDQDGEIYSSVDVDSYFDCGMIVGDILFWGERFGKITGYNMGRKAICFCSYINDEARKFYHQQSSLYPYTFPPKIGSYISLPEIQLSNYICSHLAITVLTTWMNLLFVGDIAGRISIFCLETFSLRKTVSVGGAVTNIMFNEDGVQIDYIEGRDFESPSSLCKYKEAVRVSS